MKIPFLCNVYSAFSHIRSRSFYSLPPLFTIFPDVSGLKPAIDCRWKGRQKGEDGNEAEGRDKRSPWGLWHLPGLVSLSDHAGPHVHSSLWGRCSGSAMGRDHVWADTKLPLMLLMSRSVNKKRNSSNQRLETAEMVWIWLKSEVLQWLCAFNQHLQSLQRQQKEIKGSLFRWTMSRTFQYILIKPFSMVLAWQLPWVAGGTMPCCPVCSSAFPQQFTTLKGPMANLQTIVPCNTIWALLIKCRCGSSQCEFVTH